MAVQKIAAVVVDTQKLVLYRSNGTTLEIPQGDPRVRTVIKEVVPVVERGGIAEIDFEGSNAFQDFEAKSGGIVRLFRVAKKAVAGLFDSSPTIAEPGVHGRVPSASQTTVGQKAVDEILKQAVPASDDRFAEREHTPDETIVAVIEEQGTRKLVPGVEALKDQFRYSAKLGSTRGVENLIRRLSKVINQRPHSVQDLLTFLEKGDLPVADDGSIIAYKILRRGENHGKPKGSFVDPYTKKVQQRVGSYVKVDPSMVDPSRSRECSNGLHIARRGYINSFGGDLVTLCKIAPEDVIVVPHNDANKIRVCGYHILFLLPDRAYRLLKADKPMTSDDDVARLLSRAIAGDHPAPAEEVLITKQMGEGVVIRPLNGQNLEQLTDEAFTEAVAAAPVDDEDLKVNPAATRKVENKHLALDDERLVDKGSKAPSAPVDPKKLATESAKRVLPATKAEQARAFFNRMVKATTNKDRRQAACELLSFQRQVKKGWATLGIAEVELERVRRNATLPDDPTPAAFPKMREPASKVAKEIVAKAEKAAKPLAMTKRDHAQELLKVFEASQTDGARIAAAKRLVAFKQSVKKGWDVLGINQANFIRITSWAKREDKAASEPIKPLEVLAEVAPPVPAVMPVGLSRNQKARWFYDQQDWIGLWAFKRQVKLGWGQLGFFDAEIGTINANQPKA